MPAKPEPDTSGSWPAHDLERIVEKRVIIHSNIEY